jgi:WD40 repeat protein
VSTSKDRTIKLWELETGNELRTLSGHEQGVRAATFDETGSRLASGSDDGVLKVWDVKTGHELRSMKGSQGPMLNLFFSPDGRHLLAFQSVQHRILSIWRVADGEQVVEDYFLEAPMAPRNWPYRAVFEDVARRAAHRP